MLSNFRPFQEQSYGHAQALGKNEANYYKTVTKRKEFYQNVTAESRLAHLRHGEAWDWAPIVIYISSTSYQENKTLKHSINNFICTKMCGRGLELEKYCQQYVLFELAVNTY